MNKGDLIQRVKTLDGLNQDEKAYLINLVNTKKKYGLVWEDKAEDVEEQLRENLPVLKEVVEKRILAKDLPQTKKKKDDLFTELDKNEKVEKEAPNHILIEGDNLHALTALTFTHEGKIDVIYIDPPYNTGNKDFKYNDSFVDKEDSYRHSKWLSFMNKRLLIAKRLLSEKGVIFISIDDYEFSGLNLLCDEIFSENNHIGNFIWRKKVGAGSDSKYFFRQHEYILFYANNIDSIDGFYQPLTENQKKEYKNPDFDMRGPWAPTDLTAPAHDNDPKRIYEVVSPTGKAFTKCWSYTKDNFQKLIKDNLIHWGKDGNSTPKRKRFLNDKKGLIPRSLIDFILTQDGKKDLNDLFNDNPPFDYPKPKNLIYHFLKIAAKNHSIILDFFAGSGTTLHATLQLNSEDGGNRQCILITDNENNICEGVTYERNKRVIEGYTNSKGEQVEGLTNNNLRYYRSEFVGREPSLKNKKEITKLATELLCIKEDCYTEVTKEFFENNPSWIKIFEDRKMQFAVIYDDLKIEESIGIIKQIKERKTNNNPIKVYVFSNGQYPYTEDFEEVLDCVTLCALPDAIYKAYQNVLPKKTKKVVPVLDEDVVEEELDLFNQKN